MNEAFTTQTVEEIKLQLKNAIRRKFWVEFNDDDGHCAANVIVPNISFTYNTKHVTATVEFDLD